MRFTKSLGVMPFWAGIQNGGLAPDDRARASSAIEASIELFITPQARRADGRRSEVGFLGVDAWIWLNSLTVIAVCDMAADPINVVPRMVAIKTKAGTALDSNLLISLSHTDIANEPYLGRSISVNITDT